jgi:hypothetical protein
MDIDGMVQKSRTSEEKGDLARRAGRFRGRLRRRIPG